MTSLLKYDMSPSHSVLQCFRPYLYLLCMVPLSVTITFKVIVVDTWPGGNFSSAHMDLRKGWFHQIHNKKYIQIWTYWFNTTFLSSMPDPLLFVSDLHLISRKAATLTQQLLFKNENFHVVLKHEKNSVVIHLDMVALLTHHLLIDTQLLSWSQHTYLRPESETLGLHCNIQ